MMTKTFSKLPSDYTERTYAGVLGKMIGVYLGRPFEQWSHEAIRDRLGEIWYYAHEKLGAPLVVTDDDLSGTFTFLRSLADYDYDAGLTPRQIGESWLNYIIENRTILWWGGMGMSTEHTAFLRLKAGIPAPDSGSIALNGKVVAEQIGSQIFIDGWGMIHPGDPEAAADFARRAGSVSHDGVALDGAMAVAAMVAQAYTTPGIPALLDTGLSVMSPDSLLRRVYDDLRNWHAQGLGYVEGFQKLRAQYGYEKYGGGCHMVPNHAVIVHALLHGGGDFQRSLMVANTVGYDTDCNSANVGCILGVHGGLEGIESGPDWRGPVADRLLIPTADGGSTVTDAVRATFEVVNSARGLRGLEPEVPKGGARFHFSLPGSVQGFHVPDLSESRECSTVQQVAGRLSIRFRHLSTGTVARAMSATFPSPADRKIGGYGLYASPTLYSGQRVRADVRLAETATGPVQVNLALAVYDGKDQALVYQSGPTVRLNPGSSATLEWKVPDLGGAPIAQVGLEARSDRRVDGELLLDSLGWTGAPEVCFSRTEEGAVWKDAWVNGMDDWCGWTSEPYQLVQNNGTGLLIQGTREWTDYEVEASVRIHLAKAAGLAARVQGMRRYYAIEVLHDGRVELVKMLETRQVLASADAGLVPGATVQLALRVEGGQVTARIGESLVLEAVDPKPLKGGGIGFVLTEGRANFGPPTVRG